ncbi:immunoglobulin superfamily member 6 [Microcaecilia unicolor]|uniref:immunoglobulin superfamily member 6 n=1 Tax=Microcaecilia unicolor TaxID=1415580 RepID=UPI00118665B6|nr:immunoglobulin superfamily member 6 [Microcaecilia unicolor]
MAPLGRLNFWRLDLILVLCGAGNIETSCRVSVVQDPLIKVAATLATATITCNFSATECPLSHQVFWFRYLANEPEDLCVPKCNISRKFTATALPRGSSLEVHSLHLNDSGIYICGVEFYNSSSTLKRTGKGTTLVVGDPPGYLDTENILLMVLMLLLFVYCAALLSIFLFIYQSKSKEFKNLEGRQTPKETEKHSRGRTIFEPLHKNYTFKDMPTNVTSLVIQKQMILFTKTDEQPPLKSE